MRRRKEILRSFTLRGGLGGKPPQRKPPCSAPEYHQFDFWLGDWEVTTPDGKPAGQQAGGDAQALIARRHARPPLGRMGDAWDVAHAALYLASDEAKYVTGAEIVVDGGLSATVR